MGKRICVVGAGRWGANHIRTLNELGCLGGIVERDPAVRSRMAEQYSQVPVFSDLDEALEKQFDGFTVATPAETHFPLARTILQSRTPVLVEKPLGLTVAEARALKELAQQHGVLLMAGHLMLFHGAIRTIKDMITSGMLGKLQYLYSNRLNLGTVRTQENILWSFAPHDLSIFQYLIGEFPLEVSCRGGAFLQPHVHDTTLTFLRYPGNVAAHIFVSWLHPFKEQRLVVIGSKGMLSFRNEAAGGTLHFYQKGIDWIRGEPVTRDGDVEKIPFDPRPPLTAELAYFVSNLNSPEVPLAGTESAIEVLEILERATESLLEGNGGRGARGLQPNVFIHPSSYLDDNVSIGEGTKVWHFCHIQSGARIGKYCTLGQNVNVGNNVTIGNHVKIQNNVSVYEGVELQDYVFCGPSVVFTNVKTPRSKFPQRGSRYYTRTVVKEGASLGANATVLCGTTIGRHAFVAAGSVVTKDVPDFALVMGVPARQTGWICVCGTVLGQFQGEVTCPNCGTAYAPLPDTGRIIKKPRDSAHVTFCGEKGPESPDRLSCALRFSKSV